MAMLHSTTNGKIDRSSPYRELAILINVHTRLPFTFRCYYFYPLLFLFRCDHISLILNRFEWVGVVFDINWFLVIIQCCSLLDSVVLVRYNVVVNNIVCIHAFFWICLITFEVNKLFSIYANETIFASQSHNKLINLHFLSAGLLAPLNLHGLQRIVAKIFFSYKRTWHHNKQIPRFSNELCPAKCVIAPTHHLTQSELCLSKTLGKSQLGFEKTLLSRHRRLPI